MTHDQALELVCRWLPADLRAYVGGWVASMRIKARPPKDWPVTLLAFALGAITASVLDLRYWLLLWFLG